MNYCLGGILGGCLYAEDVQVYRRTGAFGIWIFVRNLQCKNGVIFFQNIKLNSVNSEFFWIKTKFLTHVLMVLWIFKLKLSSLGSSSMQKLSDYSHLQSTETIIFITKRIQIKSKDPNKNEKSNKWNKKKLILERGALNVSFNDIELVIWFDSCKVFFFSE